MNEELMIEEMIEMFFEKKWRKRLKFKLIPKEKRVENYYDYHNGEYLDESCIKYCVNKSSIEDICNILLKEGGNKKCFFFSCSESGIYDMRKGIENAMDNGMGAIIYLGNGIGYFQGEQYIGSPERYILVNKKKGGNPQLFE